MPYPPNNAAHNTRPFDKVSFVKYMTDIGRRYRNRAIELISICLDIQAQAHEQSHESDIRLRKAIEVADAALQAAVEARKRSSDVADKKFEKAANVLVAFVREDQQRGGIALRMAAAKGQDESGSSHKNASPTGNQWPGQQKVVEFVLFKSLPDNDPIVVLQARECCSSLQEVLWNFIRFSDEKRLTLSQNPHFYWHLPASQDAYMNRFRLDPFEDFQDRDVEKFYVLTDRPGRVYIESGGRALAYGNVWAPRDAVIFKDVRGKLWGEDIIRQYTGTPNLRYCRLDPAAPNDAVWKSIRDWRELIRLVLNSCNIDIFIDSIPLGPTRTLPLPHSDTYHSSPADFSLPIRRGHSEGTPTRNAPQRQGTQEGALTEETRVLFQGLYVGGSTSPPVQPPLYRR